MGQSKSVDGFYAAYMSGQAGTSIVLLAVRKGSLIGVDVGGLKYDGNLEQLADGSYRVSVVYIVPANATLITGSPPPTQLTKVPVDFVLPSGFADGRTILINTPFGQLNAKFEKLRDL